MKDRDTGQLGAKHNKTCITLLHLLSFFFHTDNNFLPYVMILPIDLQPFFFLLCLVYNIVDQGILSIPRRLS